MTEDPVLQFITGEKQLVRRNYLFYKDEVIKNRTFCKCEMYEKLQRLCGITTSKLMEKLNQSGNFISYRNIRIDGSCENKIFYHIAGNSIRRLIRFVYIGIVYELSDSLSISTFSIVPIGTIKKCFAVNYLGDELGGMNRH